jgi:hypothetical protein
MPYHDDQTDYLLLVREVIQKAGHAPVDLFTTASEGAGDAADLSALPTIL